VLELKRDNSIRDPVKTQDRIYDHSHIVHPDFLIAERLPQKSVFCMRVAKTPVHEDVPYAGINCIYSGKCDEKSPILFVLVDAVDAKCDVEEYRGSIFTAIDQVWEDVTSIVIATYTLKSAPDAWETGEETEQARMGRVTHWRVAPRVSVKTEEEFDILLLMSVKGSSNDTTIRTPMQ
jgi:hypothetical protein